MMKKNKHLRDYIYLIILSAATIYLWYPLTKLTLEWESYTYITSRFYSLLFTKTWASLGNFDVQSMFFGSIISHIFGLNIPMYFWLEIFSILVINILVYFLVKTLTKNSTSAFAASFIFAVYFFGSEFFAPNYYATFLQRIILNVPLLLISFIFLHRFLSEKKTKYYVSSISLFFLSIFIAHFGIFLSLPILFYPLFWGILPSFRLRSFIRTLLISSSYIAIVIFFLLIQRFFGESFTFFVHPTLHQYIEGVIRQLVYMSQYPSVVEALRSGDNPFRLIDPTSTYKYVFPIVITYIVGFIVIWKKDKEHRALLLTVVSTLILSLIINIYLNRFDVLRAAGQNRYYYYPSLLFAIFWSLLITTVANKKTLIIGSVLLGFFLINAALFRQYFFMENQTAKTPIRLSKYIVKNNSQFPSNSLVVVGPSADFGPYETSFYAEQLGKKRGIKFTTESKVYNDWTGLASASASVIKLEYVESCDCVQKEILK